MQECRVVLFLVCVFYVYICGCFTVAHMQERRLLKTAFLGGDTASQAECYTSVLRNTVRGKWRTKDTYFDYDSRIDKSLVS